MNADHEEAVEFAKISKRENRVYVGNLSYDVKYRDLMEFMRGGGWGNLRLVFRIFRLVAWFWAVASKFFPGGIEQAFFTLNFLRGSLIFWFFD